MLEVFECAHGGGPEDTVRTSAVESKLIQRVLQFRDVVAAELGSSDQQQSITEAPPGFHQGEPCVFVAGTADMEAAKALERCHGTVCGHAEVAGRVATWLQSCRSESTLEVTNLFAVLAQREREKTRQCVVARNSSSSWRRAPLLLAPTSRLETSPPENTSRVGILMTL